MRTILVTGANRGIGYSFCQGFLEKGNKVIACCRQPQQADALQQLKLAYGERLAIKTVDVSKEETIKNLASELKGTAIDILINNAGVYNVPEVDHKTTSAGWQVLFATNAIGPYLLSYALKNNLEAGREKKIVNISSYMASITLNDNALECPYRASKAALNAVNKNLSIEFKEIGIMSVAIDPGWVRTDMGGSNGFLSPEESVSHITSVLEKLTMKNTGEFINYKGEQMPW
jgi:NAD(P)-dependent dehydrogenase (short-subunit alcohol dehydrogenase family)